MSAANPPADGRVPRAASPAPEAAPAPDRAEIARDIAARLARSPWVELRAIRPDRHGAGSHWVGPGDDAPGAAVRNAAGAGVYATINVIDARPAGSAKDSGVAGRAMLFIDIDPSATPAPAPPNWSARKP